MRVSVITLGMMALKKSSDMRYIDEIPCCAQRAISRDQLNGLDGNVFQTQMKSV